MTPRDIWALVAIIFPIAALAMMLFGDATIGLKMLLGYLVAMLLLIIFDRDRD